MCVCFVCFVLFFVEISFRFITLSTEKQQIWGGISELCFLHPNFSCQVAYKFSIYWKQVDLWEFPPRVKALIGKFSWCPSFDFSGSVLSHHFYLHPQEPATVIPHHFGKHIHQLLLLVNDINLILLKIGSGANIQETTIF